MNIMTSISYNLEGEKGKTMVFCASEIVIILKQIAVPIKYLIKLHKDNTYTLHREKKGRNHIQKRKQQNETQRKIARKKKIKRNRSTR